MCGTYGVNHEGCGDKLVRGCYSIGLYVDDSQLYIVYQCQLVNTYIRKEKH